MVTDMSLHPASIEVPEEALREFCRQNRIARLSRFGSVLREDFRPDSDIDILVEFEPGTSVGLIRLGTIEGELSDLMGRPVDLNLLQSLNPSFREEVLREAEVVYDAGWR